MKLHGQTVGPFSCTLIINLIHILLQLFFWEKLFRQTVVVFQFLSHDPIALNLENFPFVPTEQPTKKKRRKRRKRNKIIQQTQDEEKEAASSEDEKEKEAAASKDEKETKLGC